MKRMMVIGLALGLVGMALGGEVLSLLKNQPTGKVVCGGELTVATARKYGEGFVAVGNEVVCDNGAATKRVAGASWWLELNQQKPAPFSVTAEGLAEGSMHEGGDFCLYLDLTYTDGSTLWGQQSPFDPNPTAGWKRRTVFVHPEKPVRGVNCYVLNRNRAGKARFRGAKWCEYEPSKAMRFDRLPVKPAGALPEAGFLVRDVAAETGYHTIDGEALGLELKVKRIPVAGGAGGGGTPPLPVGGEIFDVSLRDLAGRDRAVTLVYALPIAAETVWHSSPRRSEPLKEEQAFVFDPGCGRGMMSRWPYGAVTTVGRGKALCIDPAAPAVFRIVGNDFVRRFYIAFDLGLAKEQPCAHLCFAAFDFNAADGFRGMLESYQRLYPEFNQMRVARHGSWMAFHPISKVKDPEDFGFRFKEGSDEPAWDDAHDVLTFRYTEPGTWWMPIKGDVSKLSMAQCEADAERRAAAGDRNAIAWKHSVTRNADGSRCGRTTRTPWCVGAVWSLNSAPGLVGQTDWQFKNGEPAFSKRYEQPFPKGLDGEYVDSAELYMTAVLDFDRSHFAGMKTPLCFSQGGQVGVYKGMMSYEYIRGLAEKVWPKGRFMMANYTPHLWCWLVPYLDVVGTETNWNPGGRWRPMSDFDFMYKRAICGSRPYCFLQNSDFTKFSYQCSEKFMQRSLAYGMIPGYFSANASTGHYFSQPALYDRDRPLFKKYMPLCCKLSEAGWCPVNRLVKSDNPQVITEQFGTKPGARWATVFNLASTPQRVHLRQQGQAVTETPELVTGGIWKWQQGEIEVELPPETVRLLAF